MKKVFPFLILAIFATLLGLLLVTPFASAGHSGTITSTDATGATEINEFQPTDDLYVKGSDMQPNEWYYIYIIPDTTITLGMTIPSPVVTATCWYTDGTGAFGPTFAPVWGAPLTPGDYDIIADSVNYGTPGVYDVYDAIDDGEIHVTAGFFVIPEYLFGALVSLAACFAAFVIIKKSHLNLRIR